ncbi:MAG: DNA ligase [Microvirga sp.]
MRTPSRWDRPKLIRPPGFILPCRPTLAAKVPTGDGWLHELKHDGFRIIAHKDGERVHLWSRNGRDRTGDFVAIADAMRALPFWRVMLDGEAVTHCLEGLPDFHKLMSRDGQSTACLYAFDLIWLEAQDLRGVELIGRRRMLQKALKKAGPALRFSEHMAGAAGEAMFRHACAMGLEGIISKRVASRYKSGSCIAWVKIKNRSYERRA